MALFELRAVSLLMAGAMVILPVSMTVQAKEVGNTSATIVGLLYKGDRVQATHQAYGDGIIVRLSPD